MRTPNVTSRREFIRLSALGATGAILAACSPPATQTAVPKEAPKEATKPAEPAAKPTTSPATAVAKPASATPAAAPKPTAAAAAKPADTKPGRHLIGKLEGPEIVTDPTRIPKQLKEAPMLADLVKAGKLPPVDQRVPQEPLVVKPVHEIGKYGGTWRRGFTGPGDGENGNRIVATDKILYLDYTGNKVVPSVAKSWKLEDGGKTIVLSLRKGMKWSDGAPLTADDFVFWYEDMYKNKDLVPVPHPDLSINGKPGTLVKVDALTIAFKFPEPYPFFVEKLAGSTAIGNGHAYQGESCMGAYAPAHYLKQFHPKYASKEDLEKKVKDAKMDNWASLFKLKNNWRLNTELPVLTPWRTVTPINNPSWVLERNPYYWEVDTEGNQLPYFDKLIMTLAETLEVLNLRAVAGEYDIQERHTDVAKLPVFIENQDKGGYNIHLDPALHGSDNTLYINQSYDADPEVAKWLRNRDFRRALSLGIDRDQLNEIFWLGTGTPGSVAPDEGTAYSPGPEYRKLWSTYDPAKANEMLDKIGLDKKDSQGFRLRTDGKGRLRIEIMTVGAFALNWTGQAEAIREHWKKVGIDADVKEVERSLSQRRIQANEHQISVATNNGSEEVLISGGSVIPVDTSSQMGPAIGRWFRSGGQSGMKPEDQQLLKALDLYRSAPGLSRDEQIKVGKEIWKIAVDEQWTIGTCGLSPGLMGVRIVKKNVGNVPARQSNGQNVRTPAISHPATYFFKS